MHKWLILLLTPLMLGAASLDYNATTSRESCGSAAAVDDIFDGGGTISAWIYPEGWGEGNFGRVMDKGNTIFFLRNSGSPLRNLTLLKNHSTTNGDWRTATDTISLNSWQHVIVTYNDDSTSNNPTFYIDGATSSIDFETTPSGSASSDASSTIFFGNSSGNNRTWDGQMAYVSLYDREISAVEAIEEMFKPMSFNDSHNLGRPQWIGSGPDISGAGNSCTATATAASANGPAVMFGGGLPL